MGSGASWCVMVEYGASSIIVSRHNSPVWGLIPAQVVQARPTGGQSFVSVREERKEFVTWMVPDVSELVLLFDVGVSSGMRLARLVVWVCIVRVECCFDWNFYWAPKWHFFNSTPSFLIVFRRRCSLFQGISLSLGWDYIWLEFNLGIIL